MRMQAILDHHVVLRHSHANAVHLHAKAQCNAGMSPCSVAKSMCHEIASHSGPAMRTCGIAVPVLLACMHGDQHNTLWHC